ncbi:MAG: hypothetical protein AAB367_02300 [Patescibacteria group bacterium]
MEQLPQNQEIGERELRLKPGIEVRDADGKIWTIFGYSEEKDEYLLIKGEDDKLQGEAQAMQRKRIPRTELESLN